MVKDHSDSEMGISPCQSHMGFDCSQCVCPWRGGGWLVSVLVSQSWSLTVDNMCVLEGWGGGAVLVLVSQTWGLTVDNMCVLEGWGGGAVLVLVS